MTSLAVALSADSRGPAGLYIITDSRITWGSGDYRWDAGQKTFASTRTADVFGFCGDAHFPPAVLRQVIDQVNAGLLFTRGMSATERSAVVTAALESALKLRVAIETGPFAVYHGTRDHELMKSRFRLFHTKYSKADGFTHGELNLSSIKSYLAHLDGSGKRVIETRRNDWLDTKAEGTTRAAIWAFCDALQSGRDPLSGGPPQLVGIWRNDPAQTFGFLWHEKRYFCGLEVSDTAALQAVKWFNHLFERSDARTGMRMEGAQRQRKPVRPQSR
jgi:hypothetical protein